MLKLEAENLKGITHGFFGRAGGVSTGIFASLNCGPGSGDAPEDVATNRVRVVEALLPGARLVTLRQIHSPQVVVVEKPWGPGEAPEADALVTPRADIILGILTADCAPILFADKAAGVVGAAHAGWKGAIGGVAEATLAAMERLGARRNRIAAAIGPNIGQDNYEVGAEFEAQFVAADAGNARFFRPGARREHFNFDLEGYLAQRLARAGVEHVARIGRCTYAGTADFFSFRRTTHRKESGYGRQISTIALRS